MIRRPPRSTLDRSSAASDVYKRQGVAHLLAEGHHLLGRHHRVGIAVQRQHPGLDWPRIEPVRQQQAVEGDRAADVRPAARQVQRAQAAEAVAHDRDTVRIHAGLRAQRFQAGQPAVFTVSEVVPGWTEVLQQMRVGDEWIVYLPPGELTMIYGRGPEYKLLQRTISVPFKGEATVEVKLHRWIDPMKYGFYSGDHHIHAAGCAHYTNPTEGVFADDMFLHVKGEALNVGCNLTWARCW